MFGGIRIWPLAKYSDGAIEEHLQRSDVILVVWSKRAKLSRWVDEAEMGVQRGLLVPIRIDSATLPLGFGGFNTLNFVAGDFNAQEWRKLLNEINRIVGNTKIARQRTAMPRPERPRCGRLPILGGGSK
jgi:hypothetical protein